MAWNGTGYPTPQTVAEHDVSPTNCSPALVLSTELNSIFLILDSNGDFSSIPARCHFTLRCLSSRSRYLDAIHRCLPHQSTRRQEKLQPFTINGAAHRFKSPFPGKQRIAFCRENSPESEPVLPPAQSHR